MELGRLLNTLNYDVWVMLGGDRVAESHIKEADEWLQILSKSDLKYVVETVHIMKDEDDDPYLLIMLV